MKTQNYISRYLFLTVLFVSFFMSSVYAKPLTTDEKAKRKKEVVAMLSGTTWDVELFPMDDPKKKPIKDVVSYEHGRLKSKAFAVEGYSESNLTVTIEDDGKAIWETMQSHADKGPIFWRGELAEKSVNGVLSRQNKDGSTDAYSLRGVQTGTFEVAPEKAAVIIEAPKEVIPPPVTVVPAAPSTLDALLGNGKAPGAAIVPGSPASVTAKPGVAPVAPMAVSNVTTLPSVSKPAAVAVPAKPVETYVKPVVAAAKTEVKPVAQTAVAAADNEAVKEKKSKWSW